MHNDSNHNSTLEDWEVISFAVSGGFTGLALLISLALIYQHLRNMTNPDHQAKIVRILLMVPIYAVDSWLSVRFKDYALYFDIARDCYEAYLLYQFFALLVAYIEDGKPGRLELILEISEPTEHPIPCCCLSPVVPGRLFLLVCRQSILQYVIIRPVMALAAGLMEYLHIYNEGDFTPFSGYLYVTIINLSSVTVAMYFLVLFYMVTQKQLAPYRVMSKLLSIKAILFFSFWQAVAIGILSFYDVIPAIGHWDQKEVATGLNDFILCIEMAILAIVHAYAFPYQQYVHNEHALGITTPSQAFRAFKDPVSNFARHVVNQQDTFNDLTTAYHPEHVALASSRRRHDDDDDDEDEDSTSVNIDGLDFVAL